MRSQDCFQSGVTFPKVVMHPDGEIDGFKGVLAKLFQLLALQLYPKSSTIMELCRCHITLPGEKNIQH